MCGLKLSKDWKSLKLEVLKMKYGKTVARWSSISPQVTDDRMVFINIYNQLMEAVNSLQDNPHVAVCVAMNRYIAEECKVLNSIRNNFQ